ncbi:MAG TPA: hypothetical protein VIV62_02960 [Chthoniobacterales bacterium]|jgi:hypothetical protein
MTDVVFVSILLTGLVVAFLHAIIPTHWLPFVVAARAQRWNNAKTLVITGVAGAGHVLFTTALGVLVVWGGILINRNFRRLFPLVAGGALIALGLFYLVRQLTGRDAHVHLGGHTHAHGSHTLTHNGETDIGDANAQRESEIRQEWSHQRSDWAAIAGLLALLTFSPCEAFLPVFLTGAKYGWQGFTLLSASLAVATVGGMLTFTWLTLLGLQRVPMKALEKYEPLIVSGLFCILGALIIIFER